MSNPALWTIYATARYQEKLVEAEQARKVRTFKSLTPQRKRFGRGRQIYWLKPRFRPTLAK
jgi:hypothetical protein